VLLVTKARPTGVSNVNPAISDACDAVNVTVDGCLQKEVELVSGGGGCRVWCGCRWAKKWFRGGG
jgi:hypothetical protein